MTSVTFGSELKSFFIFNPSLGGREGQEHEKVMYYYPPHVEPGERHNRVGLAETLIRFSGTFSPDLPCEAVHAVGHRQVLVEVEESLWMCLSVSIPRTATRRRDGSLQDEKARPEWVKDAALRSVARQLHDAFVMFNGTMSRLSETFSVKTLRDRLEAFFPPWLEATDFGSVNVFDDLDGMAFLPVDKDTYLLVQCFVNLTENGFPGVRHTAVLYDHFLVWSGLAQRDVRCLYRYIVARMAGGGGKGLRGPRAGETPRGGFAAGPERLHDDDSPVNAPQVFVSGDGDLNSAEPQTAGSAADFTGERQEFRLVIYRHGRVTVAFLVEPRLAADIAFYRQLARSVEPAVQNLSAVIENKSARGGGSGGSSGSGGGSGSSGSGSGGSGHASGSGSGGGGGSSVGIGSGGIGDSYRFLYFNQMNLALKTSIRAPQGTGREAGRSGGSAAVTADAMSIISDMRTELSQGNATGEVRQIMVRTGTEGWIVGQRSHAREFFVMFDNRSANLAEIDEELKRLSSTYFNNIFID